MHAQYAQRDMQEAAQYFWQAFKFKDSRLLPCNVLKSWSVTSTANSKFTTFTTDHTGLVQESTGVQQAENFASIVACGVHLQRSTVLMRQCGEHLTSMLAVVQI